ncbi:MAG: hypothetical protein UV18_C0011G0019 [Candidatus Magasanikbacteria bacterium GW2011_GWC2_42_27]|nr:MAG: hypothetical protein UV18_C0011G0019 [Candidatus Magasanikbacteria bacterium GW2011_GWC2_42_27]
MVVCDLRARYADNDGQPIRAAEEALPVERDMTQKPRPKHIQWD